MFCANCGKPLGEGVLFCRFCGAKVEMDSMPPESPVHTESPAPQQPAAPAQPAAPQQPAVPAQPAAPVSAAPVQEPVSPNPQYQPQMQPQYSYQPAAEAPVKKRKFPWIPVLIAVVVLGAAVFAAAYFRLFNLLRSNESLIRARIETAEEAMNEFDIEDLLSCASSDSHKRMEEALKIADQAMAQDSGMGMEALMEFAKMLNSNHEMFRLEVNSASISGDKAKVNVTMTVSFMGDTESETIVIPMVKERNDWYIGGTENELNDFFNQNNGGFDPGVLDG